MHFVSASCCDSVSGGRSERGIRGSGDASWDPVLWRLLANPATSCGVCERVLEVIIGSGRAIGRRREWIVGGG